MTWHTGHDLGTTLFTCQYVHHLEELQLFNLQRRWSSHLDAQDSSLELLSYVLRPYIRATIKTCDLVWCEFVKGHLIEVSKLAQLVYRGVS